jgi:hypothetical protein
VLCGRWSGDEPRNHLRVLVLLFIGIDDFAEVVIRVLGVMVLSEWIVEMNKAFFLKNGPRWRPCGEV